ncbi:zinc finger protein 271-like isoform X3 [Toxorhynchites rutilus septentrionalis]|uniref:zinc finger protein 271-like isoform X3 n=1 Tax=Toxorhynchites rutilus septentrionalis TaxID=329112 RepID=UPI00247893F0|nr:zinc finger protein 271-like isoform X3 [Toxorhynchites rutilus septentrionalis]
MAFPSNNPDPCSFCSGICNREFRHALVPTQVEEQKLKTILQKLSNITSQLSSYPTCDKCRQEFIMVHNFSESSFQTLSSPEITDIKMEPELIINEYEPSDNGNIDTDPISCCVPVEQVVGMHINGAKEELFYSSEMNENDDNISLVPVGGTNTQRKGEKSFKCEKCDKTYSSQQGLKIHVRSHTGERPYSCSHCSKVFKDPSSCNLHIRIHSDERPYTCSLCSKAFKGKTALKRHIRIHIDERPHSCPHCPKAFKHHTSLIQHIRTHTDERPYSCPHCTKAFTQQGGLEQHIRIHTGERPYPCPHCQKAFRQLSSFKAHVRTHMEKLRSDDSNIFDTVLISHSAPIDKVDEMHVKGAKEELCISEMNQSDNNISLIPNMQRKGEKRFKCEKCDNTYSSKFGLKIHVRSHTGERPYSCSHCSKVFKDSTSCNLHIRIHRDERPYTCPFCSKAFKNNAVLKRHIRIHTDDRPHSCPHCMKRFIQPSELKKHVQTHKEKLWSDNSNFPDTDIIPYSAPIQKVDEMHDKEELFSMSEMNENDDNISLIPVGRTNTQRKGEKPFKCEECDKPYSSKQALEIHVRSHTGERPYSCSHCSKRFKDLSSCNRHIRIHSDERPYACPLCSKAFKGSRTLKLHIRIHTGERPHSCPHCPRAFIQRSSLNQHIRTHTGERPYPCPHCQETFRKRLSLKAHIRTHTG